ncbi:MAG: o-succinylbenzoate synthase [Klebsiella pneumoniae]|nr:o-succinylbenzoate synthase [Klebsiella pneumoniae]
MRVSQVYRWQIPMDAGVVLRERRLKTRDGLFIRLQEGEREGWGEISPLPGFSVETLEEAQMALLAWAQAWRDGAEPPLPTQPSVAFGISCAQAELGGELPQAADYRAAPLCSGDPDELFARLAAMPGEKVAKVKVGLWEAVRDGMVVNLLLEAIPDLQLRLDANRAWTPLKAQQFAKYVNPAYRQRIAFLEEPSAHALGLSVVISSSIESSLGLTQLARIAAWLTPQTIPGLDTLSLMGAQLVRPWPESALPVLNIDALEPLL